MKIILLLTYTVISLFAQYDKGKIDMHGESKSYRYSNIKNKFRNTSMGLSTLLQEKNVTVKKNKYRKRISNENR